MSRILILTSDHKLLSSFSERISTETQGFNPKYGSIDSFTFGETKKMFAREKCSIQFMYTFLNKTRLYFQYLYTAAIFCVCI